MSHLHLHQVQVYVPRSALNYSTSGSSQRHVYLLPKHMRSIIHLQIIKTSPT